MSVPEKQDHIWSNKSHSWGVCQNAWFQAFKSFILMYIINTCLTKSVSFLIYQEIWHVCGWSWGCLLGHAFVLLSLNLLFCWPSRAWNNGQSDTGQEFQPKTFTTQHVPLKLYLISQVENVATQTINGHYFEAWPSDNESPPPPPRKTPVYTTYVYASLQRWSDSSYIFTYT